MKTRLSITCFILACSAIAYCQTIGHQKIKAADDIVWFGIDFSKVQCVGRSGFTDPNDIAKRMTHAWNDLIISESDKYNIPEIFRKDEFVYDLTSVQLQNDKVDPDGLIVDEVVELNQSDIEQILSNYSSTKYPSGVGLLFVVESLNKIEEESTVHVVVFDISSKEIYNVIEYRGKPGGFGFRNYWAGSFHDIMDKMTKDYKNWYKKNK